MSDNLYSLRRGTHVRVMCTGHVHCKSLHRAPGAPGQGQQPQSTIIKIINQSTHFINELLYTSYLTIAEHAQM